MPAQRISDDLDNESVTAFITISIEIRYDAKAIF